jgi:hypothetical protein
VWISGNSDIEGVVSTSKDEADVHSRAEAPRQARDTISLIGKMEAGESDYERALKTRNLLKTRGAQYAQTGEIAANWNSSGTSLFVRFFAIAPLRRETSTANI